MGLNLAEEENSSPNKGKSRDKNRAEPLLLLHPKDNCLVSCCSMSTGEQISIDNQKLHLLGNVMLGHKVARKNIHQGAKVIKYGAVIGSATHEIQMGEHIHLHNIKSDYLPTYQIPSSTELKEP